MPSSCPICEQPIASTAAHCAICGFPTSLAIEGLRSLDAHPSTATEEARSPAAGPLGVRSGPVHPTAASPEEEMAATISRDLRGKMELLGDLGRGPDVTSELCQAALIQAEGRVAEALDILRSAQGRLDTETEQLLDHRLRLLEDRRRALQATGVHFALGTDIERLRSALESGDRAEAVGWLVEAERRAGQFESDWRGLQGLLAQIQGLRNEATELGFPLGEISSELDGLRERLRGTEVTEDVLDTFAQESAQILMLLHDAIPASLEAELERTMTALERFPDDHPPAAVARRLHLDAGRNLKKGRLTEAIQRVRELRRVLSELERSPARPPMRERAGPSTIGESEDEMLDRLLKKARSLAGRVRTLPPESDTSHEAAVQIREATDLLRARHLKEADATLTKLMRMLASESPPPRT